MMVVLLKAKTHTIFNQFLSPWFLRQSYVQKTYVNISTHFDGNFCERIPELFFGSVCIFDPLNLNICPHSSATSSTAGAFIWYNYYFP